MSKWLFRIVLALALLGAGYWAWTVFFPSPETVIRARLHELAKVASISANEAPLAQLSNAQLLTTFFTADVEITVNVPGQSMQTFQGRDQIMMAASAARSRFGALKVEFLDITIALAPDKESASVELTGKAQVPGERDFFVQELKFLLRKVDGKWLINRVETVRTLSRSASRISATPVSG
jgi:hypothetical protein